MSDVGDVEVNESNVIIDVSELPDEKLGNEKQIISRLNIFKNSRIQIFFKFRVVSM